MEVGSVDLQVEPMVAEPVPVAVQSTVASTKRKASQSQSSKRRSSSGANHASTSGAPLLSSSSSSPSKPSKRSSTTSSTTLFSPTRSGTSSSLQEFIQFVDEELLSSEAGEEIPLPHVARLHADILELRSMGTSFEMASEQFPQILTLLSRSIIVSKSLLEEEEEGDLKRAIKENLLRVLTAMTIMTLPETPKQVIVEECVECCSSFLILMLQSIIHPHYSGSADFKAFIGTVVEGAREIIHYFMRLVGITILSDKIVVALWNSLVPPFFWEAPPRELQSSCLALLALIFTRHKEHQHPIVAELFSSMTKPSSSKRLGRNFKLPDGGEIHVLSALLLHLAQATVASTIRFPPSKSLTDAAFKDAISQASQMCSFMLRAFMEKAFKKRGEESTFKIFFDVIVEDLLRLMGHRHYPVADALMTSLLELVTPSLSAESKEDATTRLSAVDYFCQIVVASQRIVVETKAAGVQLQPEIDTIHKTQCALCLEACDAHHFALRCTCCNMVFHGDCLGLEESSSLVPETWTCSPCFILRKLPSNLPLDAEWQRGLWVSEDMLVAALNADWSLAERDHSDRAAAMLLEHCLLYTVSLLLSDEANSKISSFSFSSRFETLRGAIHPIPFSSARAPSLNPKYATFISNFLFCHRASSEKEKLASGLLWQMVRLMNDPSLKVRARAVKALASVLSFSPELIKEQFIMEPIKARVVDTSSLVREQAMDLIRRALMQLPSSLFPILFTDLYPLLAKRTADVGIEVRRKALGTLRDVCISGACPDLPRTFIAILARIGDRELQNPDKKVYEVKKLLHSIIFEPNLASDQSSSLASFSCNLISEILRDESARSNFQAFLALYANDGEDVTDPPEVWRPIVAELLSRLVTLEANKEGESPRMGDLLACISALAFFSKAQPALFVDYVQVLQPYLQTHCQPGSKGEEQMHAFVIFYTSEMLKNILPLLVQPSDTVLFALEETLCNRILTVNHPLLLESFVECLRECVGHTNNFKLVKDLLERIYNGLKLEAENKLVCDDKRRRQVMMRGLASAGLIARHFAFDSDISPLAEKDLSRKLSDKSIKDVTFRILLHFSRLKDPEIQERAFYGLGHFFVRHPYYMLRGETEESLVAALTGSIPALAARVLHNIHLFLAEEEKRLVLAQQEIARRKGATDDSAPPQDISIVHFGGDDDGVGTTIASKYDQHVRRLALSTDASCRLNAVETIHLLLDRGLVNPLPYGAVLIPSTCDADIRVRDKARHILGTLKTKHAEFVMLNIADAAAQTFQFLSRTRKECSNGILSLEEATPAFSYLYSLMNKREKMQFLRDLVTLVSRHVSNKALQPLLWGREVSLYGSPSMPFVAFLINNLAHLPYDHNEEVLSLIRGLQPTFSTDGPHLDSEFDSIFGFAEDHHMSLTPEQIFAIVESKKVSEVFAKLCDKAQEYCIIAMLKQHLKHAYNLSERRCDEYVMNPNQKFVDAKVLRLEQRLEFDVARILDSNRDKESLCKHFKRFQELMHASENAYYGMSLEAIDAHLTSTDALHAVNITPKVSAKPRTRLPKSTPTNKKTSTPGGSAKKKRKPRRRSSALDEEEDDEEDEDNDPDFTA